MFAGDLRAEHKKKTFKVSPTGFFPQIGVYLYTNVMGVWFQKADGSGEFAVNGTTLVEECSPTMLAPAQKKTAVPPSKPPPPAQKKTAEPKKSEGRWNRIGAADHNNCTEFAFYGDLDMEVENDLSKLLALAPKYKYSAVTSKGLATVILYGKGGEFSHAIKLVSGWWEEVYGNDHNRYSESTAPDTHKGDGIVAMLRKG